jgi:peptidoglycan/xylan/chitin deacetylase (PgdA/CDA1 family)
MKKFLFIVLRFSFLPFIFRFLVQRKKVTILLFHNPTVNAFDKSLTYLKQKYNIISLENYIQYLKGNIPNKLPNNAMIITFDDGHIANYDLLPIIIKHKVPLTIFLCAGIVNSNRHFWFKHKVNGISTSFLKTISNKERKDLLKENSFDEDAEFQDAQALQKNQIMEMIPFVNMQSHTMFHPILPKCNSKESMIEILESKSLLESEYAISIDTLSYPNGDYSNRDIENAMKAGYTCGITVDYGFNDTNTDIFRLKRISVNDTENISELIVKSSGVWGFIKSRNGKKQSYGFQEIPVNG